MSSSNPSDTKKSPSIFNQPWGLTWRKAVVSLPRLVPDATLRFVSPEGPQPIIVKIPSRSKHQIPLYVFIPPQVTSKDVKKQPSTQSVSLPVLLDFHGGSFIMGSCQEQAQFCGKLCRELNCIAISVDYRMGPYAQFPAALEDAEDVLNAIIDPTKPGFTELRKHINLTFSLSQPVITIDNSHLAFSGFSSGGSLALNLALTVPPTPPYLDTTWPSPLPSWHTNPIPLLLFYPSLDTRQRPHEREPPPGTAPPSGFLASLRLEQELMPTYLPSSLTSHPRASPALVSLIPTPTTTANSNSSSNPPTSQPQPLHPSARTLLILPELDSLTSSSKTWAERVRNEGRGSDLEVVDVPGMGHGWTQYPDQMLDARAREQKDAVFGKAVEFVRRMWGI